MKYVYSGHSYDGKHIVKNSFAFIVNMHTPDTVCTVVCVRDCAARMTSKHVQTQSAPLSLAIEKAWGDQIIQNFTKCDIQRIHCQFVAQ